MVEGFVEPGWEPVKQAFEENFSKRGEVGAGVVVRRHGRVVVDLWGGLADPRTGRRWEPDTPGVLFSATKGLAAMVLLLLLDEGLYRVDAPLADVWPEFARAGKERVTARMILNHRAGLSALDQPLTLDDFRGGTAVHDALIAQVPLWEPDTDQGYAACSYGAYVAEIARRLTGRSIGALFAERIARPLGISAWIGLPVEERPRVARLIPVDRRTFLTRQVAHVFGRRTSEGRLFRRVLAGPRADAGRAFLNPTLGPRRFHALNDPEVLALELPWMGGVASAGALATAYAALIGEVDGVRLVRPEQIAPLRHRQSWSARDRVLQKAIGWSQGFVKDEPHLFSRNTASFGHPGAGGAVGWADPDAGVAWGYVMNRMDWRIRSPRATALAQAIGRSIGRS